MSQKFDFWEIYDICVSDTGVNIIVQSDDMLNGLCIRMTADDALKYAKRLKQMAEAVHLVATTIKNDEARK